MASSTYLEQKYYNLDFSFINKFFIIIYRTILIIYQYVNNLYDSVNKYVISNYLDGKIYQINYITLNNNYNKNLYYLFRNLYQILRYFFGFNKIKYNVYDIGSLYYINNLLYNKSNGYLHIKYYKNNTKEEVLINLNNFYNSNIRIKNDYEYIKQIINNFISNYVIYNDILHVGINNTEITDKFLLLNNSFKYNNITLHEFKILFEIIFKINLKISKNLILTNNKIKNIVFKNNDYLNFKTLYEHIVDNIEKKSN